MGHHAAPSDDECVLSGYCVVQIITCQTAGDVCVAESATTARGGMQSAPPGEVRRRGEERPDSVSRRKYPKGYVLQRRILLH